MYQSNNINNIFLHNTTMTKEANNGNGRALHPAQTLTNIKSHVPLTLDFKTVQYNTWAELFQVVARAHSVMNHLDGSPRATTKKWIQIDAIVLSWIYSTISEDLLPTILEPGSTARGAWLRVKKARVADLENQFNNCKLANFPDAKSYCQHLKSLADQLSDLGNVVSDQRLVLQLVKGLTLAYETVGITISSLEPLPSFCAVRKILETDVWKKRNLDGSPKVNGFRSYVSSFLGLPGSDSTKRCMDSLRGPDGELPEKLRNLEPHLIEHISNEIMDRDPNVRWDDIAGLHQAKKCVTEMVIWPLLRPDIFKGCRAPGRGLLLFGPPGTGKTMIGKAIAGEAKATFFYISASSLTSKWVGDSEKLVRALFGVASCRQPAVIFVDEIDSLLSQRKSSGEHDSIRRLKTQFLIEMEGFDSGNEQLLLIGATNRPQELDEAARRRLTKRLYIPLPSSEARAWIVRNLLEKDGLFKLSTDDIDNICKLTEGYSGSDMKNLVKDASMGPLREVLRQGIEITKLKKEDMRPVTLQDFEDALQEVRPSVSLNELGPYEDWNNRFGSLSPSSMKP